MIRSFPSIDDVFWEYVPDYRGHGYRPFFVRFKWDRSVAEHMEAISPNRCQKRRDAYLINGELERATQSIRFGNKKSGRGYREKRGDFCLIAGAIDKQHLTLFYRRLELIGGLHYDLPVIAAVEDHFGPLRTVTVFAVEAKVFALARGSNEKLYAQLVEFYESRA